MVVGIENNGAKASLGMPMQLVMYGLRCQCKTITFAGVACAWQLQAMNCVALWCDSGYDFVDEGVISNDVII